MNEELLKEKYIDIRIRMKRCKTGSFEKRVIKKELTTFIKEVESSFGKEAVVFLTKKPYG
jgi:galactitol-specific phosphotransferase system IIB component